MGKNATRCLYCKRRVKIGDACSNPLEIKSCIEKQNKLNGSRIPQEEGEELPEETESIIPEHVLRDLAQEAIEELADDFW